MQHGYVAAIKHPTHVTLNHQKGRHINVVTSLWKLSGVLVSQGFCTILKNGALKVFIS